MNVLRLPGLLVRPAASPASTSITRSLPILRRFSSTPAAHASEHRKAIVLEPRRVKQIKLKDKKYDVLVTPPYPYGEALWYKQSNQGLYGGLAVRAGNNVSDKTETKTRRTWHPNIVRKNIFSAALNRKIKLRVSTRVLRTIDKVGGLDEYLLGEKEARVKELGVMGWHLRWAVMMSEWGKARLGEQAKALGLSEMVRAERGWIKKSEFEEWLLRSRREKAGVVPTPEEIEEQRKFDEGELSEREQKLFLQAKADKLQAERDELWADPEVHALWYKGRGTRVIVAKSKTVKGKETQRVLVLKESNPALQTSYVPETVEEWTEQDDERVAYGDEAIATLGAEDAVEAELESPKDVEKAARVTA